MGRTGGMGCTLIGIRVTLVSLLILLGSALPFAEGACPDLSGQYHIQGEDGSVTVAIKQTRCERLSLEWWIVSYDHRSKTLHRFILDGRFRADTGWFGERNRHRSSARFNGPTLDIIVKPSRAKGRTAVDWHMSFERLSNGDLCHSENTRHLRARDDLDGSVAFKMAENGAARTEITEGRQEECQFSAPR